MRPLIFSKARPGGWRSHSLTRISPWRENLLRCPPLIREVGEALESVAETLADGIVEESELRITTARLEAVIQECASLKYLLEDLSKKRKRRTKNRLAEDYRGLPLTTDAAVNERLSGISISVVRFRSYL
jgi:hypothetical protein